MEAVETIVYIGFANACDNEQMLMRWRSEGNTLVRDYLCEVDSKKGSSVLPLVWLFVHLGVIVDKCDCLRFSQQQTWIPCCYIQLGGEMRRRE
jgi:hypothetical protein